MLHRPLGVSAKFAGSSTWDLYGDAIQELDVYVGHLMGKIDELSLWKNTIVVHVSDNGRRPGRNEQQPIWGSNLSTFEGGIRVPSIIWGSGLGISSDLESNELIHAVDWYPTLAPTFWVGSTDFRRGLSERFFLPRKLWKSGCRALWEMKAIIESKAYLVGDPGRVKYLSFKLMIIRYLCVFCNQLRNILEVHFYTKMTF